MPRAPRRLSNSAKKKLAERLHVNRVLSAQNLVPVPKYLGVIMAALIFVALIMVSVYLEGRQEASTKNEFYVPSTNQNSVVLKIYGDNLICAPFTELENGIGIQRRYFIIRMSENPNIELIDVKFDGAIKMQSEPYPHK